MRCLVLVIGCLLLFAPAAEAGAARVKKVLPHYLDLKGRHTLSPSLYERDAYQDHLRKHLEEVSTLRFDIHWTASRFRRSELVLKLELRGTKLERTLVLEEKVKPRRWFGRWTAITLERDQFVELGEVLAWRASLWQGEHLLAEQKSFLW